MGKQGQYDDATEVVIFYTVTLTYRLPTTIGEIATELARDGDPINAPDMSGVIDAESYAYELLAANAGIRRDSWLMTAPEREVDDETVEVDEVS